MFNLTTAFDSVPSIQFVENEKNSKEELKFQVWNLEHEYLALLIERSIIYC